MTYVKCVHWWYEKDIVLWNLFRGLKDRYLSIMNPDLPRGKNLYRYNRITIPHMIPNVLYFWKTQLNHKLYMDLVRWKKLSLFNWDFKQRAKQKQQFNEDFDYHCGEKQAVCHCPGGSTCERRCGGRCLIEEVDFAIDVDAIKDSKSRKTGKWQETLKRAQKVREWLNNHEIKYSVWNSSNNGFQFWCDGAQFTNWKKPQNKIMKYHQIALQIMADTNIELDTSIYDLRRLIKLPYSLSNGIVVLPLTTSQLRNWSPRLCEPVKVMTDINLKDRGWQPQ